MKKVILVSSFLLLANAASAQAPAQQAPKAIGKPDISNPTIRISEAYRIPFVLDEKPYFGNSVSVLTPSTFKDADAKFISEKFPDKGDNLPKIVMTDGSKRAILSMNIAQNVGDRESIIHFYRDIKNDIRAQYPTSRFLKTDVIRGRSLGIIEVILPNKDSQNIYNMMAFRYVGEKFFMFNFTCPEEDMPKWQNTAREIAENVKVNYNR
jgi:hypothetical protein